MGEALRQTIARVNLRLSGLLEEARRTLRGETTFGVEDIRSIRLPVEEMAEIVARSAELRRTHPEICGDLDLYKSQLGEMQTTLAKIRLMLLARQASMQAGRAQLTAVANWINAFRQTR
jgi:hypothetical protein